MSVHAAPAAEAALYASAANGFLMALGYSGLSAAVAKRLMTTQSALGAGGGATIGPSHFFRGRVSQHGLISMRSPPPDTLGLPAGGVRQEPRTLAAPRASGPSQQERQGGCGCEAKR